jgi:uncharacterized protein involved in outer membrane biogenesis
MRIRIGTVVKILVVAVVALLAAGVAIVKSIDLNQYKGLIAEKAEAATGRKLTLAGDIYLNIFSLSPSVAIDDVSFANASWGSRPEMAKLKRLEAQVELIPLLSKNVVIKRFVLVSPDILLETDASGKGNWSFAPAGAAAPAAPAEGRAPAETGGGAAAKFNVVAHEVDITDGTLTYRDGKTKKQTVLALTKLSAQAESESSPVKIAVDAKYNDAPFKVAGTVGAISEIQAPSKPFPIDIDAEAGGAKVKAIGTIAQPAAAKGIDLNLNAEGKTLADLAAFAPGLPDLGPYRFAGHLADKDANMIVDKISAMLGKSDLSGDVTLVKAEKPTVRANLSSKLIDLVELQEAAGGAKGGAAGAAGGEAKAPAEAKPAASDGRIFSDAPLPVEALKSANADVNMKIAKVETKGPELNNVSVTLALNNGKLAIKPLQADVVNGHIDAETQLDAGPAQPVLMLTAKAKDLDLAELVKEAKVNQKVTGKLNFDGTASGQGQSVRAIMAGLNGHTALDIGEMRVDNTLMKIVMADLAKAVTGTGDASKINCVVSRFDIVKGMATSKALVVDAESVTIRGSGTVNLATEQLDLYLDPSPKAAAIADVAIPVKITGTLANPSVAPDAMAAAKKIGGAVAGVAGGVATGGGLATGVLGKVVGGKVLGGGEAEVQPAGGGNPCLETASATGAAPAAAGAPAAKPSAAPPAPALPAPAKPSSPVEDVGKKLKGLFE